MLSCHWICPSEMKIGITIRIFNLIGHNLNFNRNKIRHRIRSTQCDGTFLGLERLSVALLGILHWQHIISVIRVF